MERRIPIKGMILHKGSTVPSSWGTSDAHKGIGRVKRVAPTGVAPTVQKIKTGEAENLF